MVAAREGKTETVVELVKAGANVDMQNAVCTCIYMYIIVQTQSTPTCMYNYGQLRL